MVKAREGIVNLAEEVIIKSLQSDDEKIRVEAAKTTLRMLGRNYGWGEAGSNMMAVSVQQDPDSKKV